MGQSSSSETIRYNQQKQSGLWAHANDGGTLLISQSSHFGISVSQLLHISHYMHRFLLTI
jgi:hypothetical protein